MMSQRSKRELAEELQGRYLKSSKQEKTRLLDEFVVTTDYSRKYAKSLLKNGVSMKHKKKAGSRKKKYQGEVIGAVAPLVDLTFRMNAIQLL